MNKYLRHLPSLITLIVGIALLAHGAISQWANYHEFADQTLWHGIPHAMDVLSNLGFALAGALGLFCLQRRAANKTETSDAAYAVFCFSLLATSLCSSYYHLAPDDARLFWDRLPIATACASLLIAVRAEVMPELSKMRISAELFAMTAMAIAAVWWWQATADLRPYLALQVLTLILIPLWQWSYPCTAKKRWIFIGAIALYVLAKATEMHDLALLEKLGWISGHSLKHLLAAGAGLLIVWGLRPSSVPDK